MKNSTRKAEIARFIGSVLFIICGLFSASAQSTSQSYPTAISTAEISGQIAARDLGDSRLTSYYYNFGGAQGDVFINIKTSNLDGDIDVFTAENLRPLTKITVFSDLATSETGRVIYLRKPEKLILRIEGRSPNEQPATFNLKFAGSFVPVEAIGANVSPAPPEIKIENETGARVNSVGTIIEAKPNPKTARAEIQTENPANKPAQQVAQTENIEARSEQMPVKPARKEPKKARVKTPKPVAAASEEIARKPDETETPIEKTPTAKNKTKVKKARPTENVATGENTEKPNPLENVRLVIELKDGTKIERPMSEVLRVGVDKGVLTLITKGGAISRYSIMDVAKMTIE